MSKTKKVAKKSTKKVKRVRYYGLTKVRTGAKFAWLSYENKNGWSLGFALDKHTFWLKNVRFSSPKEVERVLSANGKVVFVHKAEK